MVTDNLEVEEKKEDIQKGLKETTIMYSGGLDSTATAVMLSEFYDRIHLLTFNNGYVHLFIKWSKKNFKSFSDVMGKDRFVHHILVHLDMVGLIALTFD